MIKKIFRVIFKIIKVVFTIMFFEFVILAKIAFREDD